MIIIKYVVIKKSIVSPAIVVIAVSIIYTRAYILLVLVVVSLFHTVTVSVSKCY